MKQEPVGVEQWGCEVAPSLKERQVLRIAWFSGRQFIWVNAVECRDQLLDLREHLWSLGRSRTFEESSHGVGDLLTGFSA